MLLPSVNEIGRLPCGSTYAVIYSRSEQQPAISWISMGCFCTKEIDRTDVSFTINYQVPRRLPEFYVNQGLREAPIEQYLTVHFDDGTEQLLRFRGTMYAT